MRSALFVLFLLCSTNSVAVADTSATAKTIEQRLIELEEHKRVMDEWYASKYLVGKGRVIPFLGESISLGGFFEGGITHIYGDDMKRQTATNAQGLGLNISAVFSDKTKFVAQTLTVLTVPLQNPHNNPNLAPFKQRQFFGVTYGSTVTQGYLEISKSDYFNFQMGVGYVPFGHAFQQRELVLFHKRAGPQMLSATDNITIGIASALWTGVHIYGQFPHQDKRLGYSIYTFTTATNVTELGVGGRLWWAKSENLTAGFSLQSGPNRDGYYLTHAIDLDFKYDRYGIITEYAYSDNTFGKLDTESYYIEPYMKFADGEWLVYVSTDYLNMPERVDPATRVADPIKIWEHSLGVNWLPLPNVRLRLGYVKYDYIGEFESIKNQKRDWNSVDFSAGIAF